jgi:hypothetical protein
MDICNDFLKDDNVFVSTTPVLEAQLDDVPLSQAIKQTLLAYAATSTPYQNAVSAHTYARACLTIHWLSFERPAAQLPPSAASSSSSSFTIHRCWVPASHMHHAQRNAVSHFLRKHYRLVQHSRASSCQGQLPTA